MKNKKVLVNALVYVANNIFVKAFQFFLVPIYTAFLSTEEYGINTVIANFTSIVGVIMALSVTSATMRMYTDYKNNPDKVKSLFGSIYLFSAVFGLLAVGALFLLRNIVSAWFLADIPFFPVVSLALINLWLTNLAGQYTGMLQAMQEAKESALINGICFFCNLVLNIVFVAVLKLKLSGIFYSGIIVNSAQILFGIYRMRKRKLIRWHVDRSIIKEALKYSVPLIPHSLSSSISQYLSKLILGSNYSMASVGVYALAGQFGHIIDTVQSAVHSAYLPWFFELRAENSPESIQKVKSLLPTLLDLYGAFFLAVALFCQEVVLVMADSNYADAWLLIPLFVCIYAVKTPYYFYSAFLFYRKDKTRFIFLATITSNLLNVLTAAVLIPKIGMYGAIVGDLVGVLVLLVVILALCNGENKLYFGFGLFLKNDLKLFAFIACGLLPSLLLNNGQFSWLNLLYKITVWIAFIVIFGLKHKTVAMEFVTKLKNRRK